jgi:hypothetical protein
MMVASLSMATCLIFPPLLLKTYLLGLGITEESRFGGLSRNPLKRGGLCLGSLYFRRFNASLARSLTSSRLMSSGDRPAPE